MALGAMLLSTPAGCAPADPGDFQTEQADRFELTAALVSEDWCLEIEPSRAHVLLGEPIVLVVRLENCSSETQRIQDLLAPEYGFLSVLVARPGAEEEEQYVPAVRRDGRGTPSIELVSGEASVVTVPIYYSRDGWFLEDVGTYAIRAEYRMDGSIVVSELVDLEVSEPRSERHRSAASLFMRPEASRFFLLRGGDEEGTSVLRSLANTYPGTPWAAYSELALALDLHASTPRTEASCSAVVDHLSPSLSAIADIAVASDGIVTSIDCLRTLGRFDEAERLAVRIQNDHWGTLVKMDSPGGDPGAASDAERGVGGDRASQESEADSLRSVAVYALSRGAGVPDEAFDALTRARQSMERNREEGLVIDMVETRLGLEGEIRICAEYARVAYAEAARREIQAIVRDTDLINLVMESCGTN